MLVIVDNLMVLLARSGPNVVLLKSSHTSLSEGEVTCEILVRSELTLYQSHCMLNYIIYKHT